MTDSSSSRGYPSPVGPGGVLLLELLVLLLDVQGRARPALTVAVANKEDKMLKHS